MSLKARELSYEEKFLRIEEMDSLAPMRNALRIIAGERGEWSGIPIPLEGERLRIAEGHPLKEVFEGEESTVDLDKAEPTDFTVLNNWYSRKKQGEVVIYRENGKLHHMIIPSPRMLDIHLRTTGMASVWGVEQESQAVRTLGSMLKYHRFHSYMITGAFLEKSQKSGIMYLFRRMRPTLAITMNKPRVEILCALCLHPIGYYEDSCAGAMCPTDDIIAHLTMMRGDEHMFWKRATQHPPWVPNAMV